MAASELQQFLAVLRGGDPRAVEELLGQIDPFLRKNIRLRLIDGRLRRVVDTTDVVQSLLKDFLSQREGRCPAAGASTELRAYLTAAVHHKVHTRLRKERRHAGGLPADGELVSPDTPVPRQAEGRDHVRAIRDRLPEATRRLFDLKTQGLTWGEIVVKTGGTPDALRMKLRRAVAAALGELGQEVCGHAR